VVQTAVVLIFGPIFEANFEDNVYASAGRNLTEAERHTYLGTLGQRAACKQP
jgi:hypothetical protein